MAINSTSNSTPAYSYLQYKNKIGGLVSGMDIDSIMEKIMKAQSAQMERLQQQKQKYEWTRDAYREVNTTLNTFQQSMFDDYALKSDWTTKTATVSSNSAVTVQANAGANGNLSISAVTQATSATQKYDSAGLMATKAVAATYIKDIFKPDGTAVFANNGTDVLDIDGTTKLSLFGTAITTSTTIDNVVNTLKSNGYNASITNGQLNISAGTTPTPLDDTTASTLKNFGFNFNQKSVELKTSDLKTADGNTALSDLGLSSNSLTVTIDGVDKVVDYSGLSSTATVNDLLNKIKTDTGLNASITNGAITLSSSTKADFSVTSADPKFGFTTVLATNVGSTLYTPATSTVTMQSSSTIKEVLGANAQDGMFALRVIQADGTTKDTQITYKATDTIDSLMKKINASGAGVTALLNNGAFSISANNTGERTGSVDKPEISLLTTVKDENNIDVANTSGGLDLFSKLTNGKDASGSAFGDSDGDKEIALANGGGNASLTVNGVTYNQTSNNFNISGYTITATGNLASGGTPVTVSSSNDVDKAVDKVKAFVETYNGLIKDLNTRVSEKRQTAYQPLTDAQKAEMTTDQITKWEEKAKAGLLKGDSTLNSVLSKMRETLYTYGTRGGKGVQGETLSSIGITTSKTWSENGKLEINEDKLRTAIEKDPDILARIFTGDGTDQNPGLASTIRKTAQDAVKTIEKTAGKATSASETSYSLGKTIKSFDDKISDWKDRLKDIEERYWNQFSAMETAIQKANSQASIFSQG